MSRGETLLDQVREELNRADSKASIVLAACGVGLAAFLGGVVASTWKPADIDNKVEWLWWFGAAAFAFGTASVALSICPTTEPKAKLPKLPSYYARLANYDDISSMRTAVENANLDEIVYEQLYAVSEIVCKKYKRLKIGLAGIAASTILLSVAVLIDEYVIC